MEVVGQASNGQEALERARELMPDLILMDIHMPGWDGLKATQLIKEEMPYVKIVMLTVSDDDKNLFEAVKSGAQGYLLKDVEPEELFELLRGVHSRGEAPISRLTAARILDEFTRLAQKESWVSSSGESLTMREREVLQLVARGDTNKEIASQLFISENTVKNHLRNILAKLHLQNRVQAVAYALREGLIDSPAAGA
jgi:DNA-binding NarL/FixJ family response regulator